MRFSFIQKVCGAAVVKPKESREHARSVAIDRVLTGKYTAIPAFIGIMGLVFWLTFNVIGAFLSSLLDMGIGALTDIVDRGMTAANVNPVLHSLVINGIFTGVGSVLSFLPVIVTLFFFLSMLEDSGYMARVAFVMDKLLRKIGLSGRSVVPMLIGFGCTVPGVMASRTLPSERDRKMTILLTPFMSCSAKLPIYSFFAAAFFPGKGALVMVILYFTGILVGILMALLMRGTMFKGEAVPFVMELPTTACRARKTWRSFCGKRRRTFYSALLRSFLLRPSSFGSCKRLTCALTSFPIPKTAFWRSSPGGLHRFLRRSALATGASLRRSSRLYGKGKRGVYFDGAVRLLHGAYNAADAAFRRKPACVLPAVHAVCGGHCVRKARAWR